MQQIYHNAAEVIVFIGDGLGHRIRSSDLKRRPSSPVERLFGDSRDKTFKSKFSKYIHSMSPKHAIAPEKISFSAIGLLLLLSDSNTESFTTLMTLDDTVRRCLFECLRQLMVAPWWERIWVVQEIVVRTAATIHYGTISVPWSVLTGVARNMAASPNMKGLMETENWKVLSLVESEVSTIERTRVKWLTEGGNDLLLLLQEFSNRRATDARDKIYGVLSLARDGKSILPNYNLGLAQIFQNVAVDLMTFSPGCTCWVGDQKRKDRKKLPSWVPDWSSAIDPADRRRTQELYKSCGKDTNAKSSLMVVECEEDYWRSAASQAEQMLQSLLSQESSSHTSGIP